MRGKVLPVGAVQRELIPRYFSVVDTRIIGFYSGEERDHRGRYLHEIQDWPDDQSEAVHDFIQWLFPFTCHAG